MPITSVLKGEGGLANNKNESGDNQGIYIKDSHFNLSGNLEIDGAGGDGGSLVTGVETINSDFDINGDMLVKGHGGKERHYSLRRRYPD